MKYEDNVCFGTSSPIVLDKGQLNRLLLMCGNSGIMPCYLGHIGWFILQQIATVLWGHSSLWPHNMQHVLYRFLPELNSHQHSLRPQWHNFSLSIKTDDLIFLVRQLFADSYWCSFALNFYSIVHSCILLNCLINLMMMMMMMMMMCSRCGHYILALWFLLLILSSFFLSSPNLSRRRLDVYHTSTHGVALVRI